MRAVSRDSDRTNSIETMFIYNDDDSIRHHFEFGGQGDGYCYHHQSFSCLENVTDEERRAMDNCIYLHDGKEDEFDWKEDGEDDMVIERYTGRKLADEPGWFKALMIVGILLGTISLSIGLLWLIFLWAAYRAGG